MKNLLLGLTVLYWCKILHPTPSRTVRQLYSVEHTGWGWGGHTASQCAQQGEAPPHTPRALAKETWPLRGSEWSSPSRALRWASSGGVAPSGPDTCTQCWPPPPPAARLTDRLPSTGGDIHTATDQINSCPLKFRNCVHNT